MRHVCQIISIALLLFILTVGCQQPEPVPEPSPFIMQDKNGLLLNTFSLAQGDFPLLATRGKTACNSSEPLDEKEAATSFIQIARKHGYTLSPDYVFHYGKIHLKLDGYDTRNAVGFAFVTGPDYESSKQSPTGEQSPTGYFYTEKSDSKISVPELMMLERLNAEERVYIALINAYQFCPEDGKTIKQVADEFNARVELYLKWVDARMDRRQELAKPQ